MSGTKQNGRSHDLENRIKRRFWVAVTVCAADGGNSWISELKGPGVVQKRRVCDGSGRAGRGRVSVVSAGVNSVPEHGYGREVVSDAGVVLDVVEPPRHVDVLLLLLNG